MKKAIALLLQFFLFLLLFAVGSFIVHPFHVQTTLAPADGHTRLFLWDGVLLMALAYLLILLIQIVARRRLGRSAVATSLALILAGLAGWMMKFGFLSRDW